jgi:hypothetical protein
LLLGLAGVALVGLDATGSSEELLGAGAVLLSAFCYAVGPMILKRRLADLDPRASMGRRARGRGRRADARGVDRVAAGRPRARRSRRLSCSGSSAPLPRLRSNGALVAEARTSARHHVRRAGWRSRSRSPSSAERPDAGAAIDERAASAGARDG